MTGQKAVKLLSTTLIVLIILTIPAVSASAQSAQPSQGDVSTGPAKTPGASPDASPSTSALQARIEAQQRQIDRLNALVEKLQAMLEPATSAQAALVPAVLHSSSAAAAGSARSLPDAAPAPPASASAAPAIGDYLPPRELLPDIGHIGAQLALFEGGATNPYKADAGFFSGGYIDLPWRNVPGGKLSYEILISLQRSVSTMQTTSGVNVLVNAALNSYLGNVASTETSPTSFLTGPLPITSIVQERAKILTVAPFELKYTAYKFGRFRPYVVAGLGTYVWIGSDNNSKTFNANTALGSLASVPVGTSTLGAVLNALLQGSQIGGLVPTAPELAARGVPHGQGNLLFGGQVGGGAEIRVTPKLSLGVEYRRNQVEGKSASFNMFAFKQGFYW